VVKTSREKYPKNLSSAEIIGELKRVPENSFLVLTGGEITVRRDCYGLVKFAVERFGSHNVAIQTNGRKLLEFLPRFPEGLFYVVAIHHHTAEIHNKISSGGDSAFDETMSALNYIRDNKMRYRLEVVLSNLNKNSLKDMIEYFLENGHMNIGITYPHMDGMLYAYGEDYVRNISFQYYDLEEQLEAISAVLDKFPDANLSFEKIPKCLLYDKRINYDSCQESGAMLRMVGSKFRDINEVSPDMCKKFKLCKGCEFKRDCPGVWSEYIDIFGELEKPFKCGSIKTLRE
jgi:MoaA/NifB/PqqE/SkfB family radical SAM enzyme